MERRGYTEETYFDISYDPVRDETGKVGGVFCIVRETTGRVLGERRLQTLRDLAARSAEASRKRPANSPPRHWRPMLTTSLSRCSTCSTTQARARNWPAQALQWLHCGQPA